MKSSAYACFFLHVPACACIIIQLANLLLLIWALNPQHKLFLVISPFVWVKRHRGHEQRDGGELCSIFVSAFLCHSCLLRNWGHHSVLRSSSSRMSWELKTSRSSSSRMSCVLRMSWSSSSRMSWVLKTSRSSSSRMSWALRTSWSSSSYSPCRHWNHKCRCIALHIALVSHSTTDAGVTTEGDSTEAAITKERRWDGQKSKDINRYGTVTIIAAHLFKLKLWFAEFWHTCCLSQYIPKWYSIIIIIVRRWDRGIYAI